MAGPKIGDEWIDLEKLEALRCPFCGNHRDLWNIEEENKVSEYVAHVLSCNDGEGGASIPGDGYLYIGGEKFGEPDLQPIYIDAATVPKLKEIMNYLEEKGWTVELNGEEEVVKVKGLAGNWYKVDETGAVYGEGKVRGYVAEAIQPLFQ